MKERARQLRKVVYSVDENWKERMPKKNEDNDMEHELSYCGKLEKQIESDEVLRLLPKVKEKLNLLKKPIEDTKDHYTLKRLIQYRLNVYDEFDSESLFFVSNCFNISRIFSYFVMKLLILFILLVIS